MANADESDKKQISSKELAGVLKCKKDVYNILTREGQLYLPPYDECTLEFMKGLLNGEKKALYNRSIKLVNVPRIDEFRAKTL